MAKLGFADRKTKAPKTTPEMLEFLSEMMSATVNNEVEMENVKQATTIASRIVELLHADAKIKGLAITMNRTIKDGGFPLLGDGDQKK